MKLPSSLPSCFFTLSSLTFLTTAQTITPNNALQVTSNPTANFDLQVSGLQFSARDDLGAGEGVFSLIFNFTDPWGAGKSCHFSAGWGGGGAQVFPYMAPCLEDDGYGYGGTVNVSSVGLKIAEAPKDDDDWTKANFELDVWHTVTFQDEGFLKLAHVKVPDDVGGKDWVCENPGYGGKRVVRCGVKIDGEFPQDALPTYPVHVEQPLALAPPGFVGDAL